MVSARQSSTSVGVWEKHNKVRNIRCGKFLCDGLAFISCRSDCDWLVCSWRILGTPEEALGFNVMWAGDCVSVNSDQSLISVHTLQLYAFPQEALAQILYLSFSIMVIRYSWAAPGIGWGTDAESKQRCKNAWQEHALGYTASVDYLTLCPHPHSSNLLNKQAPLILCKVSPANLLEGFGVSTVIVPQLSIMHIVYFNEI